MHNSRFSYYRDTVLIFIISLVAFTYGVFGRELIGFETRFGLFAKEMLNNGPSWFPTTYGMPYPDYPGLHTALIYLFSLPWGHLTTLSAILPSAIACSVTLVLIYKLLIRYDRTWALVSVLLSGLTFQCLDSARSLTMDPLVMLVSLWAFYAIYDKTLPERWLSWRTFGLSLPLILGFAIRGPIGLVIPAGIVCVSVSSQAGLKQARAFALKAGALFIVLLMLLLLAAYHTAGLPFVKKVLQMQIVGRMTDNSHHYPFWAYFTDAFANYALSFELALATVLCFGAKLLKPTTPVYHLLRQCVLWILIVMIGMSIPGVRKIRYIMPIVPALLILAGFWWYQPSQNTLKIRVLQGVNSLFLSLPFLSVVLISAFIVVTHLKGLDVNAHYFSGYFLLTLLSCGSAYILFHHPKAYGLAKPLRVLGLAVLSFWVVLVFVISPVNVSLNRVEPFVKHVLSQLPADQPMVFFDMDPDGEALQFVLAADLPTLPLFVHSLAGVQVQHAWFITTDAVFAAQSVEFKNNVIMVDKGRLGHRKVVVFCLKP